MPTTGVRQETTPHIADDSREAKIMRRVAARLIPFLFCGYVVASIDRVNIGFASLEMNHDLGFTRAAFGLAGGAFFLSYFVFEIPSNLWLQKFGASRWLSRIMITWGLVSGATAFVIGPKSFLVMRLLLGAAEAGIFPGTILFLTYWFPSYYRARMVGLFMVSIPVSGIIGSPISGLLLGVQGVLGLHGWQWMFLVEALPSVLLGLFGLFWLTDGPEAAKWLSADEREWLVARLAADRRVLASREVMSVPFWRMMANRHVLLLTLVCASTLTATGVLGIWQPIIIKSFGVKNWEAGLLNAIPYIAAALAMVAWARHSDRRHERIWHNVLPMLAAVIAMVGTLFTTNLVVMMGLMTVLMVGVFACKGPYWALATELLPNSMAAGGLAQITAFSALPSFFASYLIGAIKDATGSFPIAIMPIAALCGAGIIGVLLLRPRLLDAGPSLPIAAEAGN